MAVNLLRNARLFFTTNVNTITGVVGTTGFTNTNTYEIQVLDNLSFSQNTTQETVTINEAGASPTRGQVSFNTALDPVEFSFSTYIRPNVTDAGTDLVVCEEKYLWNAMYASTDIGGASPAWTDRTAAAAEPSLVVSNSQIHQMVKFGLIIVMGDTTFVIDNCALDQANIDFGLDAIAMINWTGRGSELRQIEGVTASIAVSDGADVTFGSGLTGTAQGKYTGAKYLTNKLSTLQLWADIGGSATSYDIPITGGSLTLANNITYLTPANLGVVNTPITYFTGTRAISGSINAYLRRHASLNKSAELLATMLGSKNTIQPEFNMKLHIGGSSTADVRVEVVLPAVMLTIPTVNVEQILTTTINFTAMGSSGGAFDIETPNEMTVKYHHPVI